MDGLQTLEENKTDIEDCYKEIGKHTFNITLLAL